MTEPRVIPPRWGAMSPGGTVVSDSTEKRVAASKVDNENRTGPLRGWRVVQTCGCGCKQSMEGRDSRAVCVDASHRARAWKGQTGYGRGARRKVRANARPRPARDATLRVSHEVKALATTLAEREGVTMKELTEQLIRSFAVEMRG